MVPSPAHCKKGGAPRQEQLGDPGPIEQEALPEGAKLARAGGPDTVPTVYRVRTESLHIPPESMRARALNADHVSTIVEGMRSANLEQLQNMVVNVYISDRYSWCKQPPFHRPQNPPKYALVVFAA